jgi:hypothetical protein
VRESEAGFGVWGPVATDAIPLDRQPLRIGLDGRSYPCPAPHRLSASGIESAP